MHVLLTHFSNLLSTLDSAQLSSQQALEFLLSLSSQGWRYRHRWSLLWALGWWPRVYILGQAFSWMNHPHPLPRAPICSSEPEVAHYYFVFNVFGRVLHCKSRLYVNTVCFESFPVPRPLSSEGWLLPETHMWSLDRSSKVEKLAQHSSCQGWVSLTCRAALLMVLHGGASSVRRSQLFVPPSQATAMFNLESRLLWQISN